LRSGPEETDDALDRLLHPEEIGELGIDLDRAVHKDLDRHASLGNWSAPGMLTYISIGFLGGLSIQ
jgi:hypothetical protein